MLFNLALQGLPRRLSQTSTSDTQSMLMRSPSGLRKAPLESKSLPYRLASTRLPTNSITSASALPREIAFHSCRLHCGPPSSARGSCRINPRGYIPQTSVYAQAYWITCQRKWKRHHMAHRPNHNLEEHCPLYTPHHLQILGWRRQHRPTPRKVPPEIHGCLRL